MVLASPLDKQTPGGQPGASPRRSVRWRGFIATFFGTLIAAFVATCFFVVIVDPYDNLAFSPRWKHHRLMLDPRFEFPGVIRHGSFDSAVFGTSTVMLLDPKLLDRQIGGRFANLGIPNGSAWEQTQTIKLFARHTSKPRMIIVGIDTVWCSPKVPAPRGTPEQPFPIWEYDENPWNDYLHIFNAKSVHYAFAQARVMLGLSEPKLRDDGYWQFVPDDSLYDAHRASEKIFGSHASIFAEPHLEDGGFGAAEWIYPDLKMLEDAFNAFPPATRKIALFAPYHVERYASPYEAARFSRCKDAVVKLAQGRSDTTVIDFMFPNALTRDAGNYWDQLHYRIGPANEIVESLAQVIRQRATDGPLFRVLWVPTPKR